MEIINDHTITITESAPTKDIPKWKQLPPLSKEQALHVLYHFAKNDTSGVSYIPETLCKDLDLNFEGVNGGVSMKENAKIKSGQMTVRDRLRAKLNTRIEKVLDA